nr:protein spinster-like [Cherax quadricarinatus]
MPPYNIQKRDSVKLQNVTEMEAEGLRSNLSHQELITEVEVRVQVRPIGTSAVPTGCYSVTRVQWVTVAILCFVNLINYMDRFTIAGTVCEIEHHGEQFHQDIYIEIYQENLPVSLMG